jgi:AraC-like DNA-binding protein
MINRGCLFVQKDDQTVSQGHQWIQEVISHIEAHLADEISMERLAQLAGFYAPHFSRMFKHTLGFNVVQYIIQNGALKQRRFFNKV